MRKLLTIVAAMLAFAVPGTALAQNHGDRGGWSRGHDAPRGHDSDYRSVRHGVPGYGYDRGYRYYRGNDHRYERRDRYERQYQKRRMHHHHRGRHWRG